MFKKGFNFVTALKNTSAFSISPEFSKSLSRDVTALQDLQVAITGGANKTEAFAKIMSNASVSAKNFAENNKLTDSSIRSFATGQRQAQVALAAQGTSLKSQLSIIKAYKNGVSNLKLTEKQFVEAVKTGNPFLGDYISKVKAGEVSTVKFTLSLIRSKAAAVGLKVATLAVNTALTMLVSIGVSFALNKIIEKVNEAKDSIDKTADSINDLHDSIKTLDEYKDKAVELRKELDNGGLSIADVTKKREELFEIQKQLIDTYGTEAKKIDFVNGNIEEQIELYDKLKDRKNESWLNDNALGIQNARKFLYTDSPNPQTQYLMLQPANEGYVMTTDVGGDLTGVSKFLSDWVENTSNAIWEYEGTQGARILLSGGRKNIIDAYDDLFEKLKQYKEAQNELTEQDIKNIEALQVAISGAKKYITDNSAYDDSVQIYEEATEKIAKMDSAYKGFYDNIAKYQKEYNDAVTQDNDEMARESYIKVQNAYKNLFDNADFSQIHNGVYGEDIRLWYEEQYDNFKNLSIPIRLKVDIEGTKREFDLSYEKLADMYAKVGDEGFVIKSDWRGIPAVEGFSDVSMEQASEFNAIRDAAKEAGVSIESYIEALVQYGKVQKETVDSSTEALSITKYSEDIKAAQDAISPLLDAYNKLQKGELSNSDIVTLISDKFPSLIQYTNNLSVGIQKLAKEKLEELKTKLDAVDKSKLSESDLKAYEKFIEYIDSLNDGFSSTLAYYEKIQSQTKSVSDSITTLIGLSKEISENGSLSLSSVEKILSDDSLISLRPYLNDVKTMLPIVNGLIEDQKQAYEDLYNEQQRLANPDDYIEASQQKQEEDENAFQNSVKRINEQVVKFKEKYGVDLSNWEQLGDGKKTVLQNTNAELLSKQSKLVNDFANYYNTDLTNFKNAIEAKEDILNRFNETKVYSQIQQIIESDPESIAMTNIDKQTGEILRFASAKAQKQIDDLLAFSGLTFKDYANYRDFGVFTDTGNTALQNKLNEILNAYTITPTTWDDMTKNIGASGGSSGSSSKEKTWFEKQYAYHNHLVNMDKETTNNYLNWLDGAYKKAYKEGIITLDDYYKYEEEVYNGRKKLNGDSSNWFEKEYKAHQHKIKMERESQKDYLAWLEKAYKQAYNEGVITLDEYRKYQEEVYEGLRNIFKDYLSDREHEISMRENYDGEAKNIYVIYTVLMDSVQSEITKARSQGLKDTDSYIQELQSKWQGYYNSRKKIIDDLKNNAESSLKSLVDIRVKMIKDDIDKEKEAIDKKLKYLKEFYDKQKELLQDKYDEEKYLEEQQEKRKSVSDIQAEIEQLRYDNSAKGKKRKLELKEELEKAQKELNDFEKEHVLKEAQNKLDELYEAQEKTLNKQTEALEEREKNSKALYDQALADIQNGSITLYNNMIKWNDLYGDGIRTTITNAWEEAYKALKKYSDFYGTNYKGVSLVNATGYTGFNRTWNGMSVSGYASGTSNATKGLHLIDEDGAETIFESADGSRYKLFTGGEKVLNAQASDFLYNFATKGASVLKGVFDNSYTSGANKLRFGFGNTEIKLGDIIVQGNADKTTVSEIRRAQRESLDYMLKQLNRLK